MSKKKNNESLNQPKKEISIDSFMKHEEDVKAKLKRKNRPIVVMTYIMAVLFLALFGHIIFYMIHDSKKVIANAIAKMTIIITMITMAREEIFLSFSLFSLKFVGL